MLLTSSHINFIQFIFCLLASLLGVERIFPINMPALKKIEVNKKGKVRQSRIYYFRELRGKKARIKEV